MSKYLGSKCIICEQDFCENDDIVVCPDCGTPYHRECYAKIGECINKEFHITGKSWKPDKKPEKIIENKICPECGAENDPGNINCGHCGAIIADIPHAGSASESNGGNFGKVYGSPDQQQKYGRVFSFEPGDKYCGMNPEEEFESVKLRELADFVKSNQLYYLPVFKKIKDTGKKISLNIVSFFFPEFFFANRKMWFWTAVSVIISTLLSIPSVIYMLAGDEGTAGFIDIKSHAFELIYDLSSYVNFAFKVLTLLFANWLYYRHAIKKINQQKKIQDQPNLSSAGGTSIAGIFISFAAEMFIFMVLMLLLTR